MIIKGSKMKLVKPMGAFTNVGEICEVLDLTSEGVILFKFSNGGSYASHLGYMSYDEYLKYFEPVVEPEKAQRVWTDWVSDKSSYYNINGDRCVCYIKYRHNGKKVQIICPGWGLKSEASCHADDTFNLKAGLKLASKRLIVKILNQQVKELAEGM